MARELTADNAYDTLALLIRARDMHEQAIREAMDLLWQAKGDQWEAAYYAAEGVFEDTMHAENFQATIDAIEELAEVLENG